MSIETAAAPTPETVAVILNWNGAEDTLRCVEALQASKPRPPRIVVVDNGSQDDSRRRILERHPELALISSQSNLGYSGGNNLGIRWALEQGARKVVLLNNDVEVEPECIARLEQAIDGNARAGVCGPLILTRGAPDRIWAAGGKLSCRENVSRLRGFGQSMNGRYTRDEVVDYLPGCVLMLRRDVLQRVGLLDESYFCYMEDVDYGRRVIEAGFKNVFVAAASAYHRPSSSTGGGYSAARKYMNAVNSVHFLRRHGSPLAWAGFICFDLLGLPLAFLSATMKGRPGAALAKLRGLCDGLRGVRVTPKRVERYLRGP
jgi:hypothetical protein